jgi:hypothetical protein
MSNKSMIGIISGRDWSGAPEGTTHVRQNSVCVIWYKGIDNEDLEYWSPSRNGWVEARDRSFKVTSKEEDLPHLFLKKVNDVEVGMFVKIAGYGFTAVVYNVFRDSVDVFTMGSRGDHYRKTSLLKSTLTDWSYTFDGVFVPFLPTETEQEKKIRELKATIDEAKKQIDELSRGKV